MKILLTGLVEYEWFAPAWAEGLRRLEHDVHIFGWEPCFSRTFLRHAEHRFMLGPGIRRINRELVRRAKELCPDLIVVYLGNPIHPHTIEALRELCWVTSFHHDDAFGAFGDRGYFRLFRRAIAAYDSHHVVRPENIVEFKNRGSGHVGLFKRYYVPWLHYPRSAGPSSNSAGLDVVFVGHVERDARVSHVETAIRAGLPLRLFGSPEWPAFLTSEAARRLPRVGGVWGDDYARILSTAKILLAFHSQGNRDAYSYRVLEITACGGFLLAQRSDTMEELFEEGSEAEYFSSAEEMIDKARFYLKRESARMRIARRGFERCTRSGYDVVSRLREWSRDIAAFRSCA